MFEALEEIGIILSITAVVTYYLSLLYGNNFCKYQDKLAGSYTKPDFGEFVMVTLIVPILIGFLGFFAILTSFVIIPMAAIIGLLHLAYKRYEVCRDK